jgi:hypothetical protein
VKVDDYFKDKDVQIPYRRDLGQLNAERNMVQHNAREPEASGMDEQRVFTEKFLRQSFEQYFGLGFDEVTQVDLVADEMFRSMLRLAADTAENGYPRESLVLTAPMAASTRSRVGRSWSVSGGGRRMSSGATQVATKTAARNPQRNAGKVVRSKSDQNASKPASKRPYFRVGSAALGRSVSRTMRDALFNMAPSNHFQN